MNPTEELPLLDILRFIPGGNPLADLLQPDMSVLVNLGYGNTSVGWDIGNNPDVPTPFGFLPDDINPAQVLTALVQGIPEGITKALADIQAGQWTDYSSLQTVLDAAHTFNLTPSDTPTLSELLGAGATYFHGDVPITPIDYSSPTDIVNGLTNVVSTDASTVLPLFDTALALGVSLPNYDISLFEQGIESGNWCRPSAIRLQRTSASCHCRPVWTSRCSGRRWQRPDTNSSAALFRRQDGYGSSTTLPSTPPSARLCKALRPSDSAKRCGGGGLRPRDTSWLSPQENSAAEPGTLCRYSPHATPSTPTLRSNSRFTFTVGIVLRHQYVP